MNPMLLLNSGDPVEVLVLGLVAEHVQKLRAEEREDLAQRIARAVMGGG